jgi:sugar lactone lactonase YvrE
VVSYAATDLAASPAALTPVVTITDSKLVNPSGITIGPNNWIYVANCGTSSVTAYALTGGGEQLIIGSAGFNCPRGIAFDAAGNLWVANASASAVRVLAAQFGASNLTAAVDTTLSPPSGASQPYGIALDVNGNVWVSYCGGSAVAQYAAAATGNGVATTPDITLTSNGASSPSLSCPVALALDNTGNLWVANGNAGTLSAFSVSQLETGTPDPLFQLTNIGVTVGGLAFNPTAAGLPIQH